MNTVVTTMKPTSEETLNAMDALWQRVDDNMYHDEGDPQRRAYNDAMSDVKGLIEDAGGMNPEDRLRGNSQFGVGA